MPLITHKNHSCNYFLKSLVHVIFQRMLLTHLYPNFELSSCSAFPAGALQVFVSKSREAATVGRPSHHVDQRNWSWLCCLSFPALVLVQKAECVTTLCDCRQRWCRYASMMCTLVGCWESRDRKTMLKETWAHEGAGGEVHWRAFTHVSKEEITGSIQCWAAYPKGNLFT